MQRQYSDILFLIKLRKNTCCCSVKCKAIINNIGSTFLVVKPANQGSSIGITLVEEENDLARAISKAFEYDGEVLVERNDQSLANLGPIKDFPIHLPLEANIGGMMDGPGRSDSSKPGRYLARHVLVQEDRERLRHVG